jgi:hypothetical protein
MPSSGDQRDLLAQPAPAFREVGRLLRRAEVHLVDDGKHRYLEQDRVQPRSPDHDLDLAVVLRGRVDRDVLGIELEQPKEVDEVALDEAQAAEVGQLLLAKAQGAQPVDLLPDLVDMRCEVDARVATLEAVFDVRPGEVMQHHLHHRELVQVSVEQ